MKEWKSVRDFLNDIGKNIDYVILRSPEFVLSQYFLKSGGDIDILCESKKKLLDLCDDKRLYPRLSRYNTTKISVNGIEIFVDIYEPGDDYYDKLWEIQMLRNKEMMIDGIYVLSKTDRFFSLAYHALFHKPLLENKYKIFLLENNNFGWTGDRDELIYILDNYMKENNYKYCYPLVPAEVYFLEVEKERIYIRLLAKINEKIRRIERLLKRIGMLIIIVISKLCKCIKEYLINL